MHSFYVHVLYDLKSEIPIIYTTSTTYTVSQSMFKVTFLITYTDRYIINSFEFDSRAHSAANDEIRTCAC